MKWLWRVYNQGWPDGHEDSTNQWGNWSMISDKDAKRLAKEDRVKKRYEFVPYAPSIPGSQSITDCGLPSSNSEESEHG